MPEASNGARVRISVRAAQDFIYHRIAPLQTINLHEMLFVCQGRHIAWTGQPMLHEDFCATPDGPILMNSSNEPERPNINTERRLPESARNVIVNTLAFVRERGNLDYFKEIVGDDTWQTLTHVADDEQMAPIQLSRISDYFTTEHPDLRLLRSAIKDNPMTARKSVW